MCTDKTGTLTQDRIILKRYLDIRGEDCDRVLQYAYLNSHFQSGLKNLLDVAVLEHVELHKILGIDAGFSEDRRNSLRFLAPAPVGRGRARAEISTFSFAKARSRRFSRSARSTRSTAPRVRSMKAISHTAKEETVALNEDGFRVIAVAYKEIDDPKAAYSLPTRAN